MSKHNSPQERFDSFVCPEPNSGCYLFMSGRGGEEYGQFWYQGKLQGAHRVAWLLAGRSIPTGMWVLHKCDTPCCVNVDHLFLGNHLMNMRDMARKARGTIGTGRLPPGVRLPRGCRRYSAEVCVNGRAVYLGMFNSIEEAARAATNARVARDAAFRGETGNE